MADKIKVKIGDQDQELGIDEIVKSAPKDDLSLVMELMGKYGIEPKPEKSEEPKKDRKMDANNESTKELKELIKAQNEQISKLNQRFEAEEKARAAEKKASEEKKRDELIKRAINDKRITEEQAKDLKKDFESFEAMEKALKYMPKNPANNPKEDPKPKNGDDAGKGVPSFTEEEIAKMSPEEFEKNQDQIMIAMSKGTIS